jgi:hypothetical protein
MSLCSLLFQKYSDWPLKQQAPEVNLTEAARILGVSRQKLQYHKKVRHITTRTVSNITFVDVDVIKKELSERQHSNTNKGKLGE